MRTKWCVLILTLAVTLARAQTNDLISLLQQGLMDEQANRNLDAAIADYQSLAAQFERNRQVAATAIFRLGECYRMEGRTNEAAAQYQRILSDFTDQPALAMMSRQNLTGLGLPPAEASDGLSTEAQSLAAQIAGIESLKSDPEERARAVQAIFPDEGLKKMLLNLPKLQEPAAKIKANPRLTYFELTGYHFPYNTPYAIGAEGEMDSASLINANTNLPVFMELQLNRQTAWINNRVDFILGIQKARLKVLSATGGSATVSAVADNAAPAADEEDQEILRIQQMIQNSPDLINAVRGANTPLAEAAGKGWLKVATYLLDHGADVNAGGGMALINAVSAGNRAMVELLLGRGADVNARRNGQSSLHIAIQNGFQAVLEVLLAAKADVEAPDNEGAVPLLLAAQKGDPQMVSLLLEHRAGVNAKDKKGQTPLMGAISNHHPKIVKMLLAAGADANAENQEGKSALSCAAQTDSPAVVKMLLDAKGDPNGGSLDAPLLAAVREGDMASATLLLQAGADPQVNGAVDWSDYSLDFHYGIGNVFGRGRATPLWLAIDLDQLAIDLRRLG